MDSVTAHAPLVGYFVIIGGLCLVLAPQIVNTSSSSGSRAQYRVAFAVLAILSLLSTWTYMFRYFVWSKQDAAHSLGLATISSRQWLQQKSLFYEAWHYVCSSVDNWWWSEQLCLWTVSGLTIFIIVEGQRNGIKHLWAFMLLGQVVAISFAQNLFFVALINSSQQIQTRQLRQRVDYTLVICVALALATISVVPSTLTSKSFLPNLLLMHVLLFVPLLSTTSLSSSTFKVHHEERRRNDGIPASLLYATSAAISYLLRQPTWSSLTNLHNLTSPAMFDKQLYMVEMRSLLKHPAQSSIGFDVVFATISFASWIVCEHLNERQRRLTWFQWIMTIACIVSMPAVGVAVSGNVWLGLRERWLVEDEDENQKIE
ncbi:hypothetical protein OIO90_003010 [Microbotryomycetes sp. JL221]|nr:hypothetical protein OIO90_003010 [Microbotryomycetes sp. JL221]